MSKRKEKRSKLAVPIRIKRSAEKALPASGCTLDVAPHGARVQSTAEFQVGDEIAPLVLLNDFGFVWLLP